MSRLNLTDDEHVLIQQHRVAKARRNAVLEEVLSELQKMDIDWTKGDPYRVISHINAMKRS